MSSHSRPEGGVRPFRFRPRFPRRFNYNRGSHSASRGGPHKDYNKEPYHKDHHYRHEKYERHHYTHKRYSRSRSRSRSRSPSDKYYERKKHRSRSYSRSRSRSYSRSPSRSRSRSRSRHSRSRSRSHTKYRRSYSPDSKKSQGSELANKKEDPMTEAVIKKKAGMFRPVGVLPTKPRSAKDMPLYSDEELEQSTKETFTDVRTSLLERAMKEKQKLGLVNPGACEKSSALEALQCYSPDAHPLSPNSDHGRDTHDIFPKERRSRELERNTRVVKAAHKVKAETPRKQQRPILQDVSPPSSPVKPEPSLLSNIPGLGFSNVDEEDEFLYGEDERAPRREAKMPVENAAGRKQWTHPDKVPSTSWSDEEDIYPQLRERHIERRSPSPSPPRNSSGRSKSKLFDLEELFKPAAKPQAEPEEDDMQDEIPLMINQPRPESKKVKVEVGKSYSIWDSPEHTPAPKSERERVSPVVKRILTEASLSPFRNRQSSWRPESQHSNPEKTTPVMSEDSVPLPVEIKRTIHMSSPFSDRSKRSDSYHSLEMPRDQKRAKHQAADSGKSQYKTREAGDSMKSNKEKFPADNIKQEEKHYEDWEESSHQKGTHESRAYDKERHSREPSPKYKKPARKYSADRSPGYERRHKSPYRSPSYSPYNYSSRKRSPYRSSSPHRKDYYSPHSKSPGRTYHRSPGRTYDRSPRRYNRSPSPSYYNKRYRGSPGRRSLSYSPPQRRRAGYNRKYSRSPTPPHPEMHTVPPDIPLPPPHPPQPPPPPHYVPPYYDPNSVPPPPVQYPGPPPPFPPPPVSYPMAHPPPPYGAQYPMNPRPPLLPFPPHPGGPPIGGPPIPYPPPGPPPPVPPERANLKIIQLQQEPPIEEPPMLKQLSDSERETLFKEREEKLVKHLSLRSELEQLQKFQGEMMRKKQRQKDGHKDPLILENSKLQDEIRNKINLTENAVRDLCQALGENAPNFGNMEPVKKEEVDAPEVKIELETLQFEYFDPGNHWCKQCNQFLQNTAQFLIHLQSAEHLKKLDPKFRPWAGLIPQKPVAVPGKPPVLMPLKGAHFLTPVVGFYCSLCNCLIGDTSCADEHLRTQEHNKNYTKHSLQNPFEEKQWNCEKFDSMTEVKKQERRKLKAQELARLQDETTKKMRFEEAERKQRELLTLERERPKPEELEDTHNSTNLTPKKEPNKEKPSIKLTLLSGKEKETPVETKKKPPMILIGKAPNFRPKEDGAKGPGISKLLNWKKTNIKQDSNVNFPQRKPATKPANDVSTCDVENALAISPAPSGLVHGPHLPPDYDNTSSQTARSLPDISWEEQNDLDMLGIDRGDFVMIAAPRAPPVTTFSGSVSNVKISLKTLAVSKKGKMMNDVEMEIVNVHDIPIPAVISQISESKVVPSGDEESIDVVDMDLDDSNDSETTDKRGPKTSDNATIKLPSADVDSVQGVESEDTKLSIPTTAGNEVPSEVTNGGCLKADLNGGDVTLPCEDDQQD